MPDKVKQARQLIETGALEQAQALLLEQLKAHPQDDTAWYWMSKVVATDELREECLQEALKFNPKNPLAREALSQMKGASSVPVDKQNVTEPAAPHSASRSVNARPTSRRNTIPFAIILFVLALILMAVTYFFTHEDLAYRAEGRVVSATVTNLIKDRGSEGQPDRCQAEYQFMAYGALRKGTVAVPCSDWKQLDDTRRLQVQYLVSQPAQSRSYPPANPTERYAGLGFGLAALLIVVGIVLIVWKFWPQKRTP